MLCLERKGQICLFVSLQWAPFLAVHCLSFSSASSSIPSSVPSFIPRYDTLSDWCWSSFTSPVISIIAGYPWDRLLLQHFSSSFSSLLVLFPPFFSEPSISRHRLNTFSNVVICLFVCAFGSENLQIIHQSKQMLHPIELLVAK